MITPPKTTLNQMLKVWHAQVRAAADQPWLFTLLMRQWERLFRRFAHYYQRLLALPRPHKRALKRTLTTTLAGAALLLALGQALPARAATITVDGVTCTLAEAIASANNDNAAGNGCVDGSGADTIDLQTDVTLSALLPNITSAITLEGNGHTLDGNDSFRVLYVQPTGHLTLNHAIISNGFSNFINNGGGILNRGMLTVNDSILSGNSGIRGGGIRNEGTLTVNNSTFSGNVGSDYGGGISNVGGTLAVNDSILSGNSAGRGSGIWNTNGTATMNNSTLSGNSAESWGGGISNFGTLTLNNSTLSANSALYDGGVFLNGGGGIENFGTLTLNNSTLSGNSAGIRGGGIWNFGTANLNRSLISGNSAGIGPEVYKTISGVITANNYNVIGYGGDARSVGFTPGANDIIPPGALDTVLDTLLADNGGSTFTHALVSGSVAIDAAPDAPCLAPPINGVDQRGFPRNVDGDGAPSSNECDAGAFEYAPSGEPTSTPTVTSTTTATATATSSPTPTATSTPTSTSLPGMTKTPRSSPTPTRTPGHPTETPKPRTPTRTPTPTQTPVPLVVNQENGLTTASPEQSANPLINIVVVTLLALGNLLFFRKWRA